jgi:ABC-2 type transport system ATP-binding protein
VSAPAIVIEGLNVARGGVPVLSDLSLTVAGASITGLLGPSGSGKTTLMRAITGVQAFQSGSIRVLDGNAGDARLRPRVGYVTQAPAVYPDITVAENLRYFARILDAPPGAVDHVLDVVQLGGFRGRTAGTLSGGQRARVSLATALLNAPELLVLDEPTVGLDPVLREQLWNTFYHLAGQGVCLLVSSHVMDEAERCHSLLLLREGRLLASGTVAELKARTGAADAEGVFLALVRQAGAT